MVGESRSPQNSHEKQPQTHRVPLKEKNATFESGFLDDLWSFEGVFSWSIYVNFEANHLGKTGIIDKQVS